MKNKLEDLIKNLMSNKEVVLCVFSGDTKINLQLIKIKERFCYQITEFRNNQAFHRTVESQEAEEFILQLKFKQALICTKDADYQVLINRKGEQTILKKPPSRKEASLEHNRRKQYLLEEGIPVPFFTALGIMTADGKVIAKKSDKFKQINRFLELIQDVVPHLKKKTIRIVDFGCGKAYLTFALYHYLHVKLGMDVEIIGLDLKKEVVAHCQRLADQLEYKKLSFLVGDIKDYQAQEKIDMVVTLHACDTATDAALAKAVHWDADVILSVPCCQHELFKQMRNADLNPLLKHGILKERFTALATDAARAQLLEIAGYNTQILEFIDLEHTPKNLLIRAVKQSSTRDVSKIKQDYATFKNALSIKPSLENFLNIGLRGQAGG